MALRHPSFDPRTRYLGTYRVLRWNPVQRVWSFGLPEEAEHLASVQVTVTRINQPDWTKMVVADVTDGFVDDVCLFNLFDEVEKMYPFWVTFDGIETFVLVHHTAF